MTTNGVNPTQKSAADYKPENLRNAKEEEVRNTIFDVENNINSDMENNILADGKISDSEKTQIRNWIKLIDNMLGNIPSQVQAKLADSINSLKDLAMNLFAETNDKKYQGKNIELALEGDEVVQYDVEGTYEPDETDAESYEKRMIRQFSDDEVAATAKNLRIPDRKFESFTKFQQTITKEYNACIDSKDFTSGRIAANLKNFQAKYEEELKQIASSVSDDGIYQTQTLYDQLSGQIRYYDELARRESEKRNEEALNNAMKPLEKPSAEAAAAYGKAMADTHSHDGEADLGVLGYSKHDAQAVLNGKKENHKPTSNNITLTRHLD